MAAISPVSLFLVNICEKSLMYSAISSCTRRVLDAILQGDKKTASCIDLAVHSCERASLEF